jgi:hypothetical protein
MPLTKPPPLMTTFFHAYGPGSGRVFERDAGVARILCRRWQFAGPRRHGPRSVGSLRRIEGCLRCIEGCLRCICRVSSIDACHATAQPQGNSHSDRPSPGTSTTHCTGPIRSVAGEHGRERWTGGCGEGAAVTAFRRQYHQCRYQNSSASRSRCGAGTPRTTAGRTSRRPPWSMRTSGFQPCATSRPRTP